MIQAFAKGLWALCLCLILSVGGALAQTAPDYEAWDRVSARATQAIDANLASTDALETLRSDLVSWRSQFQAAESVNADRLATLRDQINALGPAPAEGATEPESIATRRAALNQQLVDLEAPGLRATEAQTEANGLIGEIDRLLRARQTERLFALGETPLNPTLWAPTVEALTSALVAIPTEVQEALALATTRERLYDRAPRVLLLLALALVLILRARRWSMALADRVAHVTASGAGVARFVVSLGQILFPLAGLLFLVRAISDSGLAGVRGVALLDQVPLAGGGLFFAWWLAGAVFPRVDDRDMLGLGAEARRQGRRAVLSLGILFAIAELLSGLNVGDAFSDGVVAVIALPLVILAALFLTRLGRLLRASATGASAGEGVAEGAVRTRDGLFRLLGRAVGLSAVASVLLALIGYTNAADWLIYATIGTLGLLGLYLVLQRLIQDIYGLITGDPEAARTALIPVLANLVLVILGLPILALIWGTRVTDLTELWSQFLAGVQIGDTRFSPSDVVSFAVLFGLGYGLTRLLQGTLRSSILPRTKLDTGGRNAVVSGVGYLGIFLAALVAITATGLDLSSIAIVAGALSVGIGFGLQTIVSNFVSGIILLIERPVSEGDWIEVGGVMGYVRRISVRSTRIETFDRTDVIVPNADLISGMVTNWTHGNLIGRVIVPVGVAYGTDTRRVEKILKEIAEDHPMVLLNPAPAVIFQGFGADSMDFEIRAILRDVNYVLSAKSDMNHAIAARFAEEGIEIPFAQRDINIRNPEAIAQALGRPAPGDDPAGGTA